ncbi:C40 family peptidase [Flavobacterium nackdongense]|uniref:Peptidoglycan endopeptidase n=1 Tax=Flavobacterium nackdongense TaxID=2547394 RepID=A0A4P6YHN4_9FLAO|nr:peptidoglycan endopeptidase [Flavobacterium nackdongense]QBN19993.1 peptidoglycan endopeptidase [Flavobacterium nackdongense]
MKGFKWIVFVFLISSVSVFSQENYTQHAVAKGETVSEIAKKYKVTTAVIYELNPDAVNGIKPKTVLLIPISKVKIPKNNRSEVSSAMPTATHEVLPKETVYGIAKQANISVAQLYSINPNLEKEGLRIGQSIKVPQTAEDKLAATSASTKVADNIQSNESEKNISKDKVASNAIDDDKVEVQNSETTHEVMPKESWYSISRKYGITVAALQKANPNIDKSSLRLGQKIDIPANLNTNSKQLSAIVQEKKEQNKETVSTKKESMQPQVVSPKPVQATADIKEANTTTHIVLPKESLYFISRKYGISVAEIQKANPELGTKSLKAGQKITIPAKNKVVLPEVEKKEDIEIKATAVVVEKPKEETVIPTENVITHEVLPKETKYGIAKKYGLSVTELEKQNPSVVKKLLVGSVLKIFTSVVVEKTLEVEKAIALEGAFVKEKFENKEMSMVHDAVFVEQLISRASENMGTRYRSGGTTTEGFDCSGLMCYTFANTDVKLPRSSGEMAEFGSKIDIQNAQKGDLIFFKTRGSGRINHVGMVVEVLDGEIKFIHSATHGGVMISSTKESYYERNLVQVNRVL